MKTLLCYKKRILCVFYLEWSDQCVNGMTPMMLTLGHTCRWGAQHHPSLMYQFGCTIESKGHLRCVCTKCAVSVPTISAGLMFCSGEVYSWYPSLCQKKTSRLDLWWDELFPPLPMCSFAVEGQFFIGYMHSNIFFPFSPHPTGRELTPFGCI